MNFQKKKLGLFVMLATVASVVLPAEAATKLENVKVNDSLASQTSIELQFDGPVGSYQDRLQYQPEQLVLNLSDAESALLKDSLPINKGGINDVKVSQSGENLDVVVGLDSLVPYEVSQQGNSLFLTIGADPRVVAAKNGEKDPSILTSKNTGIASGVNNINSINFKKGPNGEALIVVGLANKSSTLELKNKGSHVLAKFHGTSVARDLLAVMDVADYATLVNTIDVSDTADGAVLDLALFAGEYDSKFDQNGNTVVISVDKKKPTIKVANEHKYDGKLLSLSFQDIPVRNALKILAEEVKINLVMNDSVQGNITVNFESVPWDQALDTVLRVKGLDKRIEGNIMLVGTQDELAKYEQKQLEEREKKAVREPLVTEFIQINYAKAADIVKLLKTDDSATSISASNTNNGYSNGSNGSESSDSLLSARGTATVDERTNTLIVKDTEASIANVKRLIETLDTPVQQVVIEARIVSVDETVKEELGTQWGFTGHNTNAEGSMPMTWESDNGYTHDIDVNKGTWYNGHSNMPVPTSGSGLLQVSRLVGNFNVSLTLAALESEGRTEIISSPRITTTNQKEALIEQGYEIPAVTNSAGGNTTVEWKKAVLGLTVTPQITPDDAVFLDLVITQDELGQNVQTVTGPSISLNTRKVETQVLVSNGDTIVLGGIFQQQIAKNTSKIPLLGDIPVVGWLFKSINNENSKREVLIFITPHIVKEAQ
ncbi:MAG: type IV pilus secretin PilQ [Succinivibrionaceae bacterium]